jgi:hypothetical protein
LKADCAPQLKARVMCLSFMGIETLNNPTDDSQFVELVTHVIAQLGIRLNPEKLFVMKIDNWFDHKWLNFSGIGRVGFHWGMNALDTALDEFSEDKITFPPFHPRRVVGEWYYVRDADGRYVHSLDFPLVHKRKPAPSAGNLHKRVDDFAKSAVFVWWSSNTKPNCRGSLMVYDATGLDVQTWYASFLRDDRWHVVQTKGIAKEQVVSLIEPSLV